MAELPLHFRFPVNSRDLEDMQSPDLTDEGFVWSSIFFFELLNATFVVIRSEADLLEAQYNELVAETRREKDAIIDDVNAPVGTTCRRICMLQMDL